MLQDVNVDLMKPIIDYKILENFEFIRGRTLQSVPFLEKRKALEKIDSFTDAAYRVMENEIGSEIPYQAQQANVTAYLLCIMNDVTANYADTPHPERIDLAIDEMRRMVESDAGQEFFEGTPWPTVRRAIDDVVASIGGKDKFAHLFLASETAAEYSIPGAVYINCNA
jgi:hypothetical protein